MTRLFVGLDLPTAGEAVAVAKRIGGHGVGLRVGARLLAGVGPMVIASLRETGPVLADARVSGAPREVVAALRSLASYGASLVSVQEQVGRGVLDDAAAAVERYGSQLLAVGVPPEAEEPAEGRGRAVSAVARRLVKAPVAGLLGLTPDIGVVAQVAGELPVVVTDAEMPASVIDALARGARASIVDGGIAHSTDPEATLVPFVEALAVADTIGEGGS